MSFKLRKVQITFAQLRQQTFLERLINPVGPTVHCFYFSSDNVFFNQVHTKTVTEIIEHKRKVFELIYCCQRKQFWRSNYQTEQQQQLKKKKKKSPEIKLQKAFVFLALSRKNFFRRSFEFFLYLKPFGKKKCN